MSTHLLISPRARTPRPCLFLDRDGILFNDTGYIGRYEDVTWIAGAKDLVRHFNRARWFVVVVTNQSGVSRGYFTMDDVNALHQAMLDELNQDSLKIDAIYTCPYHPQGLVQAYCDDHYDRKPKPGMIEAAISDLNIDASRSFLLGDKPSDVEAAHRAGMRGYLFPGGNLLCFAQENKLFP